jgi:DNA-binding HxlR family transcriptional regulator
MNDMTTTASYGQFCPVAMAAEILCNRWTVVLVRELLCGSTRFNDLRRGVPRMSPALLSKRLKELELSGVITVTRSGENSTEYHLTEAGEELRPVVMGIGFWGQKWIESRASLRNLDPSLLMWDMRRHLNPEPLPKRRCTIQFLYHDLDPAQQNWWLVVSPDSDSAREKVDLCNVDPGFEVDLLVQSTLRSMTAVWMGLTNVQAEVKTGQIEIDGDTAIAHDMQKWLSLSPFAGGARRAA